MGIGLGALAAITVAGVLGSVRGEIDQADAALFLVLVVIGAAYTGGRRAGAVTGAVAAVAFDFFLTRPFQSLIINSTDDVVASVLLLAVGLAVGQIAASRQEAKVAGQAGADEVAGLYRVAGMTADGAGTDEVIEEAVQAEVASVLRLRECRFQRLPLDPPLPELEPTGRMHAPYVFEGDGFALPGEGVTIAVRDGSRMHGWLVCTPVAAGLGISRDRRRTALILADHLALTFAARAGRAAG